MVTKADEVGPLSQEFKDKVERLFGLLTAVEPGAYDAILVIMETVRHMAAAAEREAAYYKQSREKAEKIIKYIHDRLLEHLRANDLGKVETPAGKRIEVKANDGPAHMVLDPDANPYDYRDGPHVLVVHRWNLKAIRESLERGEDLPFARMDGRGFHVEIE